VQVDFLWVVIGEKRVLGRVVTLARDPVELSGRDEVSGLLGLLRHVLRRARMAFHHPRNHPVGLDFGREIAGIVFEVLDPAGVLNQPVENPLLAVATALALDVHARKGSSLLPSCPCLMPWSRRL
jgi:hypothetical protein